MVLVSTQGSAGGATLGWMLESFQDSETGLGNGAGWLGDGKWKLGDGRWVEADGQIPCHLLL